MIGLTINGLAQPKFGSKKVYLAAMAVIIGTIFLPVFSTSLPILFGGESSPSVEALSTAYAAEICPLVMRRYLTAFVNICWGFELLFSAGVVRASLELDSQWGWRSLSWFNGCGQYHCSSLRVLLLKVSALPPLNPYDRSRVSLNCRSLVPCQSWPRRRRPSDY